MAKRLTRYLGNSAMSLLTKIASGYWHLADSQCGYTAINLAALKRIEWDEMYKRYGQPNDLLVRSLLPTAYCLLPTPYSLTQMGNLFILHSLLLLLALPTAIVGLRKGDAAVGGLLLILAYATGTILFFASPNPRYAMRVFPAYCGSKMARRLDGLHPIAVTPENFYLRKTVLSHDE